VERGAPGIAEMISILVSLSIALLLLWMSLRLLTRGGFWPHSEASKLEMREIDLPALRNLLSREEDEFLKASLPPNAYRRVRRARISAVQQYLEWIAENCATLLRLIELSREQRAKLVEDESAMLAAEAVRLRAASLGLWLLLGLQYLFPVLDFRPTSLVRNYERLSAVAVTYLSAAAGGRKPLTRLA
jgi:hypothetical protein